MYETKLVAIILCLDLEEKRKLRKTIKDNFVNKDGDIFSFYKFIDSKKKLTKGSVTKLKAHEYLYPNTPYNDLRIRHLIWLTTEIVEEFFFNVSLEQEEKLKEKLLAKFYINKNLFKYANKIIENSLDKSTKSELKNAEHFKDVYDFGVTYYDLNSRNNRTEDFKINQTIHSFTVYTIVEVLKSACYVNTIQKVMEIDTTQYLLQPILEMLPTSVFLELPLVRIYYHVYLMANNENEDSFERFLQDIKNYEDLFSIQDLNGLYRMAINFCIKKSNQNIKYFTEKTFELYLYTIAKGILLENNEINRFVFTNTITLGIKLKAFDKIDLLLKNYSNLINNEYKKNTIDYNNAKILYAQNVQDKALKILLTNEFKDTIWNLNAKFIVSKIYFEKTDIKSLKPHLKSFKIYIGRKSNIGYHKNYFSNVILSFYTLINAYKRPEKYVDFSFDIETPDADWFNKMLNEIKNKNNFSRAINSKKVE